ncbi:hypothetical protein EVAR_31173_1 [Eumeta japonica]|uniref:Uncharacterized protein n=1 Tax=Eumeta variegata TaxID=151549 RepID=A0A4C1VYG0_EUMVA|nr:hypothetical protein EVAR_31173_1 [Eumeta japonica]
MKAVCSGLDRERRVRAATARDLSRQPEIHLPATLITLSTYKSSGRGRACCAPRLPLIAQTKSRSPAIPPRPRDSGARRDKNTRNFSKEDGRLKRGRLLTI